MALLNRGFLAGCHLHPLRLLVSMAVLVNFAAGLGVAATESNQRGSAGYVPQVNAGDRALRDHEYIAAASHYRNALEWDSNGVSAHVGLGNVYLKTGQKQRALEQFAAALKVAPHSAEAERGIHEARSDGQEQEAFQELEIVVTREPNNADIHTTYAEELLERDRVDEAESQAKLSLKLDPHQWHAFGVLGEVALRKGDLVSARSNLEIAVKHDEADDDSLLALGDLELRQKNYTAAVKDYRKLTKLVPEESEGHLRLADALDHVGDSIAASTERELAATIEKRTRPKQ